MKESEYHTNISKNFIKDFTDIDIQKNFILLLQEIKKILGTNKSHIDVKSYFLFKENNNIDYIPEDGLPIAEVIKNVIINYLNNALNAYNGLLTCNVIPPVAVSALLAKIACTFVNPNLVSENYSGNLILAESHAIAKLAKLIGYDSSKAGGYFIAGSTLGNLWSLRLAIEKYFKNYSKTGFSGINSKVAIVHSALGHYTNLHSARLFGVGTDNVITVNTGVDLRIDLDDFFEKVSKWLDNGYSIIYIYLIAGGTDTFAVDDISSIYKLSKNIFDKRSLPMPHIHIDAAIGWVYKFFDHYDLVKNELALKPSVVSSINEIQKLYSCLDIADSITLDIHKHGYAAYTSSAYILKNKKDLSLLQKPDEETPYFNESLFMSFPGAYTNESSRPGEGALMFLANLAAMGVKGYQEVLSICISKINYIKSALKEKSSDRIVIVNDSVPGSSCVWRIYPKNSNARHTLCDELLGNLSDEYTKIINDYNDSRFNQWRKIRKQEDPILGYSNQVALTKASVAISGIKCVILNPYTDPETIIKIALSMLN